MIERRSFLARISYICASLAVLPSAAARAQIEAEPNISVEPDAPRRFDDLSEPPATEPIERGAATRNSDGAATGFADPKRSGNAVSRSSAGRNTGSVDPSRSGPGTVRSSDGRMQSSVRSNGRTRSAVRGSSRGGRAGGVRR